MKHDPKLHESRKATEERSYERCREAGIPRETARQIASEASEQTHRTIDRRESGKGEPR